MDELTKKLEEFKASLPEKTDEDLNALKEELIAKSQELDKEAAEKKFTLKAADGEALAAASRSTYGNIIATFLSRVKTNWQSALMMKVIVDFWKSGEVEIGYPILDTTLRQLGTVEYVGYDDYAKVSTVNDFFEAIRTEFVEFTDKLFETANKLNMLDEELKLRATPAETQA